MSKDTQKDLNIKVQVVGEKNKGGRPRKHVAKSGVTRETRVSIAGMRDLLTVHGKDPRYHYYWELDSDENGSRIRARRLAGYEFVQADEVSIGQASVYKSYNVGTIVRVPTGGDYLYLMKIPMEWHEDDLRAQEEENLKQEQKIEAITNSVRADGGYGKVELSRPRTSRI